MKFYHATNHEIQRPDEKEHARNLRSVSNGNSALGLFCNTNPAGSNVYGDRLYSFSLKPMTNILEIRDEFKQPGRCMEYYRGIRDILLNLGYHAIKVTYDAGLSVVVLDFDYITDWAYVGDSK